MNDIQKLIDDIIADINSIRNKIAKNQVVDVKEVDKIYALLITLINDVLNELDNYDKLIKSIENSVSRHELKFQKLDKLDKLNELNEVKNVINNMISTNKTLTNELYNELKNIKTTLLYSSGIIMFTFIAILIAILILR